jgi:hypothetical protein
MVLPKIFSLISIVLLMGWMLYLLLGSMPLLIVKHDDPSDSRLVRGFFDVHYKVLVLFASIGALSAALADRRLLAAYIGCMALIGVAAHRIIVHRMDTLRGTMHAADDPAIRLFRRLHVAGLLLNVLLLAGFMAALSASSADIVSCVQIPPGCQGDACRVQCSLL